MAKYKVTKSKGTGWWYWECKGDPDINGWSSSKKGAKQAGKAACTELVKIILPTYNVTTELGNVTSFQIMDLDGKKMYFPIKIFLKNNLNSFLD